MKQPSKESMQMRDSRIETYIILTKYHQLQQLLPQNQQVTTLHENSENYIIMTNKAPDFPTISRALQT